MSSCGERVRLTSCGRAAVVPIEVWARGGNGGLELAEVVARAAASPSAFRPLYPLESSPEEKIEIIARRMYGASGVSFSEDAKERLEFCRREGYAGLPICMAKTPLSLSHDPKLTGRPEGFVLPINDIRIAAGAGFIYPLAGNILTMPGLPKQPAALEMDLDEEGLVDGLS